MFIEVAPDCVPALCRWFCENGMDTYGQQFGEAEAGEACDTVKWLPRCKTVYPENYVYGQILKYGLFQTET